MFPPLFVGCLWTSCRLEMIGIILRVLEQVLHSPEEIQLKGREYVMEGQFLDFVCLVPRSLYFFYLH